MLWDLISLVLVLLNVFMIPMMLAFFDETETKNTLVIRLISDLWFIVDIYLNFRTGILTNSNHVDSDVIMEKPQIRMKYLKGWFFIDFIASVPWDIFALSIAEFTTRMGLRQSRATFASLKVLKLVKMVTMARVFRISRMFRYVSQWERMLTIKNQKIIIYIEMMKQTIWVILTVHLCACLQFLTPMFWDFPETSWMVEQNLLKKSVSWWTRYSWSLY